MAEGFLKHFLGDSAEVFSAGVETHGVNPRAAQVMAEAGIDLSGHTSNLIGEYADRVFDYVITVCDNARERCPYFPAQPRLLHQSFPDPARVVGSEAEVTDEFRRVRDLIE
ncbi:putative arsenate reductase [Bacteroidales bacterium KA00344]|nr:putative arsenate reductase [Bacteroidales bacterium KA00344]